MQSMVYRAAILMLVGWLSAGQAFICSLTLSQPIKPSFTLSVCISALVFLRVVCITADDWQLATLFSGRQ